MMEDWSIKGPLLTIESGAHKTSEQYSDTGLACIVKCRITFAGSISSLIL